MKCSGRLLMLSDFWCRIIGGAIKFSNPIVFDFTTKTPTSKCYPKQVIKTYLDYIHLADTDELDLLDLLLLLDFLNSGGRQESEFEQELAGLVYNDLIEMNYGMDTKLMIFQFMKSFDSSIKNSDDRVANRSTIFQKFSTHVKQGLTQFGGDFMNGICLDNDEKCDVDEKCALFEYMFEHEGTSDASRRTVGIFALARTLMEEIETEHIVFGCGNNENGQLGIKSESELKPVACSFGEFDVVDANVETCLIDRYGQLEVNGEKETRLRKPIKAATTGGDGSRFALDVDGKLLTWGGNSFGQLGHGDQRWAKLLTKSLKRLKRLKR